MKLVGILGTGAAAVTVSFFGDGSNYRTRFEGL